MVGEAVSKADFEALAKRVTDLERVHDYLYGDVSQHLEQLAVNPPQAESGDSDK